jgi:hypothetical protein
MKNAILLSLLSLTVVIGKGQQKKLDFNTEIEKWKTELFNNGEVAPPCDNSYEDKINKYPTCQEWMQKYPDYYFGLSKIESKLFDFNSDGITDGLFFFPAINCVCGNGSGSDFAMLVYSNKQKQYTNKHLSNLLEEKIGIALNDMQIYEHHPIHLKYSTLKKTINGSFSSWNASDAHCCPSINGSFSYNPTDFSITIKIDK